eukprot:CAMPEP_0195525514 /NCGR_PEP_ID=MMETSP0794_2-20130614/25993_1 /TAXON_ID=515487 /ORGANISM="Stephanopyxis turris, Strain CCMP 815" /LENGTH=1001 /DNA_ID=CAMNT_0040655993 /DNA_START=127 /DNA_END=3133 /DNA_ORIENTATION=-
MRTSMIFHFLLIICSISKCQSESSVGKNVFASSASPSSKNVRGGSSTKGGRKSSSGSYSSTFPSNKAGSGSKIGTGDSYGDVKNNRLNLFSNSQKVMGQFGHREGRKDRRSISNTNSFLEELKRQSEKNSAPTNDIGDDSFLEEEDGTDDSQFYTDQIRRDDEEFGQGSEKGALYDAYNLLHNLAQDFQKPFDAPAVVVVGHQSSGKSALIEALMGFQFNQVGGGTKTRRPVALRMQYNPKCAQPRCFLQGDDGVERPKSLQEIQEYIQSENARLERDPVRCFDSREINVRMEYKYCPNMILIDTPGMIAAPRTMRGRQSSTQQRALLSSAREAERLVVQKMRCPDYIILCVEDTADWKHGATREVVQKADPDLSRTVIVQTKLDTKIPQFAQKSDVQEFLKADIVDRLSPHKLGGPFFTSVPSGRVGRESSNDDYTFANDDEFVTGCQENEDSDRAIVKQRLKGSSDEKVLLPRVGLSRLRGFLERRVDETYRRNVAKIVPLLQAEHAKATKRLKACERELDALSVERLKEGTDKFCDSFCAALKEAVQGSIVAPPSLFGETLQQESLAAGSFNDIQSCPMAISSRTWDRIIHTEVGNCEHRLYGGSQYHRALREFSLATRCLRLPTITEDEIANACGVGDTHDGVNFLRASCIIALEKARTSFDPMLDALKNRAMHVMGRLCPVSEYMLRQKQERSYNSLAYYYSSNPGDEVISGGDNMSSSASDVTGNPLFRQMVRTIFEKFVENCAESTMARCRDDITSLTRFVTWDLQERSGGALRRSLPDQTSIVSVYQVAVKAAKGDPKELPSNKHSSKKMNASTKNEVQEGSLTNPKANALTQMDDDNEERDYYNLLQLMEEAACSRNANRTNLVVGGLVQHIVANWREAFCNSVTTKFNCFFLLPFVDDFQRFFRTELTRMYEGDLCDVFDLGTVRRQLQQQRDDLMNECAANKRLQDKFDMVSRMMQQQQQTSVSAAGREAVSNFNGELPVQRDQIHETSH